ncbi:phosphate signaling complex protein PhoU [Maridesulfovibrio hydrothermalis]|uniref:Phosphate-specific transport system accessory protein PhoU n=1 Tax=Maridesulfovibrio hydrothermalis AM13 = DSM 14728 TaxID=1121451 RepID=L0RBK0_9BACT|nr:phosphate signaling complex protein PhoU [Maridesulfovibrio hydrothermalis]CCO24139.1 Phosphate uptake regulator, PhoU [Maridesulfovibrio hydrothermalis AM13 = DSM 14728]
MDMHHPLKVYEAELAELQDLVLELGYLSLDQINRALKAFADNDAEEAEKIIERDNDVNDLERKVDRTSLMIVTKMEPKAADLRYILSCSKIASDLERIADYAKSIANKGKRTAAEEHKPHMAYVQHMGQEVTAMLAQILAAFKEFNVEKALEVWHSDSNVDALFKEALIGMKDCVEGEDPDGKGFISLLFTMRCLERCGDHITNVAEHIYFIKYAEYYPGKK